MATYYLDNGSDDPGHMFRKVKEVQDKLLASNNFKSPNWSQPFEEDLKGIGEHLCSLARQFMKEQQYEMAESLLFQLPALKVLDNLVEPFNNQ